MSWFISILIGLVLLAVFCIFMDLSHCYMNMPGLFLL